MSDDQAFTFPSATFPELAARSAWRYTLEELAALKRYADQVLTMTSTSFSPKKNSAAFTTHGLVCATKLNLALIAALLTVLCPKRSTTVHNGPKRGLQRGVEIVWEMDVPGHSGAAVKAMPDLFGFPSAPGDRTRLHCSWRVVFLEQPCFLSPARH